MTLTINLSDEQAEVLRIRAAAEGLSVEELIQELAKPRADAVHPLQAAANIILESMKNVPPEIMAQMPADGASQHDHYIYGWPKRDV
jgi:hypothetical protein